MEIGELGNTVYWTYKAFSNTRNVIEDTQV